MVALQVRLFEGTTAAAAVHALPHARPSSPRRGSRLSFAPGLDLRRQPAHARPRRAPHRLALGPPGARSRCARCWATPTSRVHALEHMDRSQPLVRLDPATLLAAAGLPDRAPAGRHLPAGAGRRWCSSSRAPTAGSSIPQEIAARRRRCPRPDAPSGPARPRPAGARARVRRAARGRQRVDLPARGAGRAGGRRAEPQRSALSVFQRDVLVGYRFALNDEAGKELLLGAIFDTERSGESLVNAQLPAAPGRDLDRARRPAPLQRQGRRARPPGRAAHLRSRPPDPDPSLLSVEADRATHRTAESHRRQPRLRRASSPAGPLVAIAAGPGPGGGRWPRA